MSQRKNMTLMNVIKIMMAGRNVPNFFWPETAKWEAYILSRSPTLFVKDMILEEVWNCAKPTIHHFKVFGCLAFVHILNAQRKKLDVKSIKYVHLGMNE